MSIDVLSLVESEINITSGQCKTCRWVAGRPTDEAEKWDAVLADRASYPHTAVARAIGKADPAGTRPSAGSIENHRNGKHRQ